MSITTGPGLGGHGGWGGPGKAASGNMWLFQSLGLVGAGALSLTVAGKIARPALAVLPGLSVRVGSLVTRPINWALYNAYSEMGDIADWARGEEMALQPEITARPWMLPAGYPVMVPFPWFDIKAVSSGGGGGPPVIPNLHRPPSSIEENGKTLHEQGLDPMVWAGIIYAGARELSKRRCPKGKRWSRRLRRCVDKKLFPPGFTTIPYIDRKG